jgi:hypothetical protein
MNEGKRLESGFPPANEGVEDYAPPAVSERRPTLAKFDPEYDVAASVQCFRAHARLLLETAEAAKSIERQALSNYLLHVRELLQFTIGWLEQQRSVGSVADAGPMIATVRAIVGRTRISMPASNDDVMALGFSFDALATTLESL